MTATAVPLEHSQSILGTAHGIVTTILSPVTSGAGALAGVALSAVVSWVLGGARAALIETAHMIGQTTAPQLTSAWFSATYWRVAGLAALITVPFLCAAAIHAVTRADLGSLGQSVLVSLPIAVLAVNLAAPVVMLLLAATDQMCAAVAGAGTAGGAAFLASAAGAAGGLSAIDGSPFFAVSVGLLTAGAALALTVELLVRAAAVYVVVLMLPLVFAGLVWPARRIWVVRLIELLVGLILSKFVIVAVLSLAGAALGAQGGTGGARLLTAMSLVLLSTFAPWVMLRLLPFTELAASMGDALSSQARRLGNPVSLPGAVAGEAVDLALAIPGLLGRDLDRAGAAPDGAATDGAATDGAGAGSVLAGDSAAGGQDAAAGAPAADEPASDVDLGAEPDGQRPEPPQRRPGMAPIWQAGNGEWPPMQLGPDGWEGPTAFTPPEDEDTAR